MYRKVFHWFSNLNTLFIVQGLDFLLTMCVHFVLYHFDRQLAFCPLPLRPMTNWSSCQVVLLSFGSQSLCSFTSPLVNSSCVFWFVIISSSNCFVLFQIVYVVAMPRGGGTDLEEGYGDVRPWRPPFHASPAARKGPISSKRVSSRPPFEKIWKF